LKTTQYLRRTLGYPPHSLWRLRGLLALVAVVALGCSSDADSAATGEDAGGGTDVADVELIEFDRSDYTDVGLGPLDYSDPALWACRPDAIPNVCDANLDATVVHPDGTFTFEAHEVAADPGFDCFYVYPTVNFALTLTPSSGNETDFADIAAVSAAVETQGARFSEVCRVFAPLYRQSTSGAVAGGEELELARQDVRDAFAYYMDAHNGGRDVVLVGHSQGTHVLTSLTKETFDVDAQLRQQLLSALLIGGDVTVADGDVVGGTFDNVPICTAAGQRGCIVAYSSFAAESPPGDNTRYGVADAGLQTACTNPSLLAGGDGLLDSIFASAELPGDVEQPWARYPGMFRAECVGTDELSYLEVSVAGGDGDVREPPTYRTLATEFAGFGLHTVEYELALGSLIELVALQAQ